MKNFYRVSDRLSAPYYRLYFGDDKTYVQVDGLYKTVDDAKRDCWRRFGELPIRVFADEVEFNAADEKHAALKRIENRHSGLSEVVAVGTYFYLIRRNRFGAEVRVNYQMRNGMVQARNDTEFVESEVERVSR